MSQTAVVTHQKAIRKDNPVMKVIGRVLLYTVLIAMALFTLIPFVWMLSSSLKLDQEVFQYPIRWIPETFHWENYRVIWERVSLLTYFKNTAIIALAVTFLQTLTSSFAAYAFAKLHFKGRDLLFVAYIATIAVPWQAYMLPQFIMMRSMGLYDTLLAMIVLQAFSAFGVFLMRQFYQGIPTELCEAARIDGLSEYGIWAKIMLPLSTAAIATLVIFTFVGTWNDYMGPMIYLTREAQQGLREYIHAHDSMIDEVRGSSYYSDPIAFELDDGDIREMIRPYIMGRIVDVEEFLHLYHCSPEEKGVCFDLDIDDAFLPWNNRPFRVWFEGGNCTLTDRDPDYELRMSIATLSTLLIGYKTAAKLARIGRITGSDEAIARLDHALLHEAPYISDYI